MAGNIKNATFRIIDFQFFYIHKINMLHAGWIALIIIVAAAALGTGMYFLLRPKSSKNENGEPTYTGGPRPQVPVTWKVEYGTLNSEGKNDNRKVTMKLGEDDFKPFYFKGFAYSPVPPCCPNNDMAFTDPKIYSRDLAIMKSMGVNAIRLYGLCDQNMAKNGWNICSINSVFKKCKQAKNVKTEDVIAFLDEAWNNEIFVFLSSRTCAALICNDEDTVVLKQNYESLVRSYVHNPAVAGFIIGNETNPLCLSDKCKNRFNEIAQKIVETINVVRNQPPATGAKECGRLVTTAFAGTPNWGPSGIANFDDVVGTYINVWGYNPYAFIDNKTMTQYTIKPSIFMENGLHGAANFSCDDPCTGAGDCKTTCCKCSTSFAASLQKFLVKQESTTVASGVFIFEFNDEYWKSYSAAQLDPKTTDPPPEEVVCQRCFGTDLDKYPCEYLQGNHGVTSYDTSDPPKQIMKESLIQAVTSGFNFT